MGRGVVPVKQWPRNIEEKLHVAALRTRSDELGSHFVTLYLCKNIILGGTQEKHVRLK
jgi:hypothetical protein